MLVDPLKSTAKYAGYETGEKPRYRLVSRIATGSTAELFLAVMPGACDAAKPVVIKMLWPEMARDPECVRRFLDEARLSLQLHHPNVLHCYESGFDGSRYFLTMEYLDGQSLKHLIDKLGPEGGLSLPLSLKIISDVLCGLEYVHTLADLHGTPLLVVHRDVSPQNVLVTYDGAVKLVDFGIAQSSVTLDRTHATGVEGRMAYMAPEQAAGRSIDHRADLFSVGVMLWEAVTGRRLWEGLTDEEVRRRLCSGDAIPRLPSTRGLPPGLGAICDRALAIDPADRYTCASEFQADLTMVLTGSAPVQARLLGEMVSRLFASERALVRCMMQQCLVVDPHGPAGDSLAQEVDAPPPPRLANGTRAAGTVLYDRHSSTSISSMGDDVTAVGPRTTEGRSSRKHVRVVAGFALLLLLVVGFLVILRNSRRSHAPGEAALLGPHGERPAAITSSDNPEPARPATVTNAQHAAVPSARDPAAASTPQRMPGRPIIQRKWRPAIATRVGSQPSLAPSPALDETKPAAKRAGANDIYELVDRKTPPAASQSIDRDDPYSP